MIFIRTDIIMSLSLCLAYAYYGACARLSHRLGGVVLGVEKVREQNATYCRRSRRETYPPAALVDWDDPTKIGGYGRDQISADTEV